MAAVFAMAVLPVETAFAQQQPIVYPSGGQTSQKMQYDRFQCYEWAKGQTGFDPMAPPSVTAPPPRQQGGCYNRAWGACMTGRGYTVAW